jgi:hypothetical protein
MALELLGSGGGSGVQLGGDLGGTTAAPTVAKIQGTTISAPPGGSTAFLRGDGTWVAPSSGGTTYTGTAPVTVAGSVISVATGTTAGTVAAGNDSRFLTVASDVQTSSYTLALSDAGEVVEMNSASATTVTVPPNSSVNFPVGTVVEVCQFGAGQVTLAGGSGVTLLTPASMTTRARYSTVAVRQRAANQWVVTGDLT